MMGGAKRGEYLLLSFLRCFVITTGMFFASGCQLGAQIKSFSSKLFLHRNHQARFGSTWTTHRTCCSSNQSWEEHPLVVFRQW
jgi:hypothetical protein